MSKKYITVTKATGTGAISLSTSNGACRLDCVTIHFNSAPTASEDLTIKLKAKDGTAYDTTLYTINPSTGSTTDIIFIPDAQFSLEAGDSIELYYLNSSAKTFGARIVTQGL